MQVCTGKRPLKLRSLSAFGAGNGNSERARAVDPALAKMFQEAQQNILRLNESRLNALSELKAARKRISDLEKRLAEAAEEASAHTSTRQQVQQQQTYNPYQAVNTSEPLQNESSIPAQTRPTQQSVTIAYGTGWDKAYIHFKTQNQDWTQVPGVQMHPGSGELQGSKVAVIPGSERVEFVLNNGAQDWDTPDPYGGGNKNYVIDSPGTYYLKSGRLQKLT